MFELTPRSRFTLPRAAFHSVTRWVVFGLVCYIAVFSVVTQCSSPQALGDDTKNGCVADYAWPVNTLFQIGLIPNCVRNKPVKSLTYDPATCGIWTRYCAHAKRCLQGIPFSSLPAIFPSLAISLLVRYFCSSALNESCTGWSKAWFPRTMSK